MPHLHFWNTVQSNISRQKFIHDCWTMYDLVFHISYFKPLSCIHVTTKTYLAPLTILICLCLRHACLFFGYKYYDLHRYEYVPHLIHRFFSGIDCLHLTRMVSRSIASKTHSSATVAQPFSYSVNHPNPAEWEECSVPLPPQNGRKPRISTVTPIASSFASNRPSQSIAPDREG